ncbi:phospholipase D family protein [Pasteurella oralis]|uniref:phospholipase D family protein n=1 Tax=Pasteurella oralis TaxID=1071947 RepID=UPI000C7A2ED1|nr:phospholipase D family protein [Pasteurella oralis]
MLTCLIKKLAILCITILTSIVTLVVITYKPLPNNSAEIKQTRRDIDPNSLLAQHVLPLINQQPELTGIYPLNDGQDAFLARLALVETAQRTLDLQYYIWHNDISGHLLLQSVYKAAERGVKVRLLLDDNNTKGMDSLLTSLNAHPNINIRLFNPFMQRDYRLLGYLSDFFRLNRRMHNKSLTADGLISIVGGRNIGDEYFGAGNGVLFADLDVAAVGEVVAHIETDFDRYWNSKSVYPLALIVNETSQPFDSRPANDTATQHYLAQLAQLPFAKNLKTGSLQFTWSPVQLISDDPAKGLGESNIENTVLAHIAPIMQSAKNSLIIVSPYFVPTSIGVDFLKQIAQIGPRVSILTNSLEATDVSIVHSGYAKYRKALLENHIHLYELKPNATVQMDPPHHLLTGGSSASLHAKTFSIDHRYLFVGSFNMDPRSAMLNTEMGLIIDSPTLAQMLVNRLHIHHQTYTFSVALNQNGDIYWETQEAGKNILYETEPHASLFKRICIWFLSLLPVEHLL